MLLDGRKLKRQRIKRGLSQVALAGRAGLDTSAVSEYETGKRQPHPQTLLKLAEALGCNVEAIMIEED